MTATPLNVLTIALVLGVGHVTCTTVNGTCAERLSAMATEMQEYKTELASLKAAVQGLTDRSRRAGARGIAFSAVVSHNTDVNLGMAVKFNKVLFNDGHGYNPSTGVFIAPIEGVYFFTFSFKATASIGQLWLELMVNGHKVTSGISDVWHVNQDVQGGNSVVTHLSQGDEVWLEGYHEQHARIHGTEPMSSFTGVWQY